MVIFNIISHDFLQLSTPFISEGMSLKLKVLMMVILFELMIVWKICVGEQGEVTPVLDLLPRIPVQGRSLETLKDKKGVVENGPHCFRNMLFSLGIEASIESLVKSVCMEK
uniref:Uncharacterized protein n=1 Tax=Pelusios castaneus TaxID=367368 RepID=A0A8C8RCN0_9SAUR